MLQAALVGANLTGSFLVGAVLTGTDLSYANLSGADLRYANLDDANLRGVKFNKADLRDISLTRADLTYADLRDVYLAGSNLSGIRLENVALDGALFSIVNQMKVRVTPGTSESGFNDILNKIGCARGLFLAEENSTLVWKKFNLFDEFSSQLYASGRLNNALAFVCPVDLSGATIRGVVPAINLAAANLTGADLRGAKMKNVILSQNIDVDGQRVTLSADLTGVTYDQETQWPDGFTPPANTPR